MSATLTAATLLAFLLVPVMAVRADERPQAVKTAQLMPGMGGLNRGPAGPGEQQAPPRQGSGQPPPAPGQPPGGQATTEPKIYHVDRDGGTQGPFTRSIIEKAVRDGRIAPDDMLWVPGEKEWKRADRFPEFGPLFTDAPSQMPRTGEPPGTPPQQVGAGSNAAQAFMIGTWQITVPSPSGGRSRTTMQYRPDGTLTGNWETVTPSGSQAGQIAGRWRVEAIDANRFSVTVEYEGRNAPSVFTLRRVDQNTVFNENANATAHRIES